MIFSGLTTHNLFASLLELLDSTIIPNLPETVAITITIVILILSILISLGGMTVIFAGIALFYRHISTGRLLIALGGGTSFTGLAIALAYTVFTGNPTSIITHTDYWLGLLLAACARWLTKRA